MQIDTSKLPTAEEAREMLKSSVSYYAIKLSGFPEDKQKELRDKLINAFGAEIDALVKEVALMKAQENG